MRQWKPRQSLRFAATIAIVGLACSGPSLPSGSGGAPDYTFADRIVFSRYCCALYSAFVIHPDGTGLRPLLATPGNVDVSSYSVSPDGKRVALTESAYQFDAIHIVDSVGHSDTRFPADHATSYAMPRWSPDGTRIAFTESWNASMTVGPDSSRHVLVALADGSGAIVIGDSAILGSGVAWSSDGQRVIYSRIGKLVGGRIWRYELEPVDGGTRVRETWDISQESAPTKPLVRKGAEKTRKDMAATLERIESIVTGWRPPDRAPSG